MLIDLIRQLIQSAGRVHPEPGLRDAVWKVKYCLRGLAQGRLTREWFALLQKPELRAVARAHPHILSKLQRPYLNRNLGSRRRLMALSCHYSFVANHLSQEMVQDIFGAGYLLISIQLEQESHLDLRLVYSPSCCKEGDLTIRLEERPSGQPVYCLTFSIATDNGYGRQIFVGGLQGFPHAHSPGRVVCITRAMHGVRPKAMAFFALQQIAAAWECSAICGVSNRMHIYRHFSRRKKIAAQYDEFWFERGGRLTAEGVFELPLSSAQLPIHEVKPNKRPMYRRRYAFLDDIAAQIAANLHRHYIGNNHFNANGMSADSGSELGGVLAASRRRKLAGLLGLLPFHRPAAALTDVKVNGRKMPVEQ